ncbi:hypothetical protein K1T71_010032 [Dendrolimus kikuchii]|uniref:Uncharacterized protein n=1 Tax=Dendrolimus kikuchii TaxID=765133 RepID=A0ACC1CQU3_9NEOP|nr:hypothetical protein K1T71_010032 [Dendrolimus kikuchii]
MSFLRGSENYVWCTTSVLGKGATGAVFQGVNKNNGEPVAVKTFNQLSHMRPHDVQMREFEVLKKVKHENIVKLLAIEEEQEGRGKVIVMELCTGGSLFNILDDPENTYGLQEHEFLLVLEHLTAGMKHLRDNNLVHRDLKPGNIMKYINEDGTTTYKLTDFGAARELQEEEQFVSLYGTEEYLHPDMYERAVLRKPVGKSFGATVDLWSIGVTLYHVATGQLPFRPYGGRRNKETMFYITTKKASGVIAGTQTTENGPIEWARDLPSHCQLSLGLRKLVTPLLAGLLEVDPHRIWSFDRFFSEVQIATSTKPVHIFHVNKAASIKVFLKPDEKFEHLQTYICEQTSVVAESQILLYKDKLMITEIDENTLGKEYPETTAEEPLMLFNKNNNNVSMAPEPDIPKFPVFPNIVSVENDASQAKTACSVGHVIKRRVEALCAASVLCAQCVARWGALLSDRLTRVASRAEALQAHASLVHSSARALDLAASTAAAVNASNSAANTLRAAAAALQQRHACGALSSEWDAAAAHSPCPTQLRLHLIAKTLVDRLRDSWQHLVRDRATRSLTYNDEQFHVLERITVAETGRRAKALLQRAAPLARARADAIADWYKVAQTVYLQTQILDKDVSSTELKLLSLAARLQDAEHRVQNTVSDALTMLHASKSDPAEKKEPRKAAPPSRPIAGGVGPRGAGVRALLASHEDIAKALANNSALLAHLKTITNESVCESSSGFKQSSDFNTAVQLSVDSGCEPVSDAVSKIQGKLPDDDLNDSIAVIIKNKEDGTQVKENKTECDRSSIGVVLNFNEEIESSNDKFITDKHILADNEKNINTIITETRSDEKSNSEHQLNDKDYLKTDINTVSEVKNVQSNLKTKEVKRPIKNHALLAINISITPDSSDCAISAYIKQRASRALQALKAESNIDTDKKVDSPDKNSITDNVNTSVKPSDSDTETEENSRSEVKPPINPLLALNISITPDEHDHAISAFIKQRAARAIKANMEAQAKGYKRPNYVNKPFRIVDMRTPVSANVANRMSSKVLKSSDLIDICDDVNLGEKNNLALNMLPRVGSSCNKEEMPRIINTSGMIMPIDVCKMVDGSKQEQKTDSDSTTLNTDTDDASKHKSAEGMQTNDDGDRNLPIPFMYPANMTAERTYGMVQMPRADLTGKTNKVDETNGTSNISFKPKVEEIESNSISDRDTSDSETESDTTESPKHIAPSEEPMMSADSAARTVLYESGNPKEKSFQEKEKGKHSGKHSCIIA